ncbi:MAG: Holliday junction resolvase RuvX [bacterium]
MKTLGIDFGEKRVGIAISDNSGIIAEPLSTIIRKSDEKVIDEITNICQEKKVEQIVLGIPLSANEDVQNRYKSFSQKIEDKTGIKPNFWDETFSTKQAQNMVAFFEPDDRKPKTSTHKDNVAAAVILQEFLDDQTK